MDPAVPADGNNGVNGWTPVLAPEADGTRTLLKVMDWLSGGGTKPQTGMYLSSGGYVTDKALAFNFNAAKRVVARSAATNSSGVATITFGVTPPYAAPPAVVPLPATTNVLSGPTMTRITNITATGCTATVSQQAILTGVVSALSGATANVLVIEA
ncbi:hypothetical protein VPH46_06825 [Sphingomonas sp. MJ1 (PH-R8)]|uniref:hypothetical protein n=1 Tax=Sphingomonas sp. MJ1 (PH-R8) TaxID=3112950 RepID=UPI003A858FE1